MGELVTTLSSNNITLIVVNNAMSYAFEPSDSNSKILHGDNLLTLAQSVYPKGLPDNTFLYHEFWESDYVYSN